MKPLTDESDDFVESMLSQSDHYKFTSGVYRVMYDYQMSPDQNAEAAPQKSTK